MKHLWQRIGILLLSACMALPMLPMLPSKAFAAGEPFSLPTGQTYYFDLSSEAGQIGTINSALPDTTLHYVPFTYAGTVNAYSLDSSSSGRSSASENATVSERSLFVADYALSHSVSWNTLNAGSLIFGKTFDTNYILRSLSVGNSAGGGSPATNEWDQILDKNSSLIKNSSVRSAGQDTYNMNLGYRIWRGVPGNVRYTLGNHVDNISAGYGFRPALEVQNASTLGANGLKPVALNFGNGNFNGVNSIQIVSAGNQFTAPSGTGLTPPVHMAFAGWNTAFDGTGTSYEAGASVPSSVTTLYALWELPLGGTYYFDLSGEAGSIGIVNPALPDTSLHYVPFTYTGTIHAYSLDNSSSGITTSSEAAAARDHRLFVADHVVNLPVSWDTLNTNNLIFSKTFDTNYTLRSLSGGSNNGLGITPTTNEWDQIIGKDASWIKNASSFSWVQDTWKNGEWLRVMRGPAFQTDLSSTGNPISGWRPALEPQNASVLGPNGIRAVPVNLGGGSMNGVNTIYIVSAGGQFTAPSGTGLTPPANMTFVAWQKTGEPGTTYSAGQSVAYTDGLGLSAVWKEPIPAIAIDYTDEQLTGFEVGGSYTIDGTPVSLIGGKLDVAGYIGKTISIVKQGDGTTTVDSDAQSLVVPARPAAPAAAGVNPATSGGAGKITGVTAAMEYRVSAGVWKDVTGSVISDLTAGSYPIRIKATATSFKSAEQAVTLIDPAPLYTVVLSNGGFGVSGSGDYASGATVSIQAGTRSGYRFNGWTSSDGVNLADADSVSTTFVMPAKAVTVSANWRHIGGGSTPVVNEPVTDKPTIDLNGKLLDPASVDTSKPYVTLEAQPKEGTAFVVIPTSILSSFADKNATFYIVIKTPYGSYQVPVNLASLIPGLKEWLAKNNLKTEEISFKITLTDKSGDKELQTAFANGLPNGKAMGAMVDFHIEILNAKTGQTIGKADPFSKALTRVIPLPKNLTSMPEQWGAFRYNETTRKFEFVPAKAVQIDGVWYVMIRSYSNSVYVVADQATSFADVQKHWARPFVELAAAKGLVEGGGGGKYSPDKAVTRAEFTAMLVRALGQGTSTVSPAKLYDDVHQGAWYYGAVAAAKELGWLGFASGSSFKPDEPLTREEMASMLAAVMALYEAPNTKEFVSLDGYKDIGSVDASYLKDVRLMVKLRIMTGTGKDAFSPKGETTRAQAAIVFIRTLRQLGMID